MKSPGLFESRMSALIIKNFSGCLPVMWMLRFSLIFPSSPLKEISLSLSYFAGCMWLKKSVPILHSPSRFAISLTQHMKESSTYDLNTSSPNSPGHIWAKVLERLGSAFLSLWPVLGLEKTLQQSNTQTQPDLKPDLQPSSNNRISRQLTEPWVVLRTGNASFSG